MKIPLIIFGIVVALIAVLMFGSIGLSRLVRWAGWPQDVLAAVGMLFVLLAALSLCAWRIGELDERMQRRAQTQQVDE